jgi:hypothetical protein
VEVHGWVDTDVERIRVAVQRRDRCRDILRRLESRIDGVETERLRCGIRSVLLQGDGGIGEITKDRQPTQPSDKFTQEFNPLPGGFAERQRQACNVAAGPRQTCD